MSRLKRLLLEGIVLFLRLFPKVSTPSAANDLIIFKPDHIGDFVLALGAIRLVVDWWRRNNDTEIIILVESPVAELAKQEFPACQIIPLKFGFSQFWSHCFKRIFYYRTILRMVSNSTLVSFRHQLDPLQMLFLAWGNPSSSFALTNPSVVERTIPFSCRFTPTVTASYPDRNPSGQCFELEAHARLVSLIFGRMVQVEAILPRMIVPDEVNNDLLVFPCANSPIREYPIKMFAKAVSAVAKDYPSLKVVLVAEGQRLETLKALKNALLNDYSCESTCITPKSIIEAVEYIRGCKIVLSVDSAPAHLATALNKPGVFVLGGGHPGVFGPWTRSSNQLWLRNQLPCYGCDWNCRFTAAKCIVDVTPQTIAIAASKLLDSAVTSP